MVDPDVVALIDEDAADISDDPVVRQGLGPSRVEHEARGALPMSRRALRETVYYVRLLKRLCGRLLGGKRSSDHPRRRDVSRKFRNHRSVPSVLSGYWSTNLEKPAGVAVFSAAFSANRFSACSDPGR